MASKEKHNRRKFILAIEVRDSKAFNPNIVVGYIGDKQPIEDNFSNAAKFWTSGGVERRIERVKASPLSSDYVLTAVKFNRYSQRFEN